MSTRWRGRSCLCRFHPTGLSKEEKCFHCRSRRRLCWTRKRHAQLYMGLQTHLHNPNPPIQMHLHLPRSQTYLHLDMLPLQQPTPHLRPRSTLLSIPPNLRLHRNHRRHGLVHDDPMGRSGISQTRLVYLRAVHC